MYDWLKNSVVTIFTGGAHWGHFEVLKYTEKEITT